VYSPKAMDHFLNPRNVGRIDEGAGTLGEGRAENSDCGDTVLVTIRVEGGAGAEARFQSDGCAGAIASCSAATELAAGRSLAQAAELRAEDVAARLDGLPDAKTGCAEMAARAVREAAASAREA